MLILKQVGSAHADDTASIVTCHGRTSTAAKRPTLAMFYSSVPIGHDNETSRYNGCDSEPIPGLLRQKQFEVSCQ